MFQDGKLRKLEEIRQHCEALTGEMNRPEVAGDPARIVQLAKEHGRLRRIMEPYEAYRQAVAALTESQAILADPNADPDLKTLAEEEVTASRQRADEVMDAMKQVLVTGDDAAVSSIILEIRAGTGGDEAALFARDLCEMYQRYCERHGFKIEVLSAAPSDLGGFKEVVFSVAGDRFHAQLAAPGGVCTPGRRRII